VWEGRDEPEGLARLALANRDHRAGVPPVELAELAREVGGALVGTGLAESSTHLVDALLQDRDPAAIAERAKSLEDHGRGHGLVPIEHRGDRAVELVEQRGLRRPLVLRWLLQREEAIQRRSTHRELLRDGRLLHALPLEQAVGL
jgi:hypothetical protein